MKRRGLLLRPIDLLVAFIIIYSISPFVTRLTSTTISTYGYLLVLLLVFMMVTMGNVETFANVYIASALPTIGYCILTFFVKTDSIFLWCYQSLLIILPVILGVYFLSYSSNNMGGFGKLIVLAILITCITTIVGCIEYPNAARYLATVSEANSSFNVLLEWHNVGGYTFVYTVVLLYPLVIFAYKQRKISLSLSLIVTFLVFALTIVTEYTIAFLLVIVSTIFYFVKKDLRVRDVLILGLVSTILLLFFGEKVSDYLKLLSNMLGSKQMQERILAISGGSNALDNLDDNRLELYRQAISIFLDNPVFGTALGGNSWSGAHSQVLMTLDQFGIIGGSILFFMYRKIYRIFFRPFSEMPGYGFYFLIFVEAILLSTINTGFFIPVLTMYAPILFSYLLTKGDKTKNCRESRV